MIRNKWFLIACVGLIGLTAMALQSEGQTEQQNAAHEHEVEVPMLGVAVLVPTEGSSVRGVVTFQQEGERVHVRGRVTGLTPGEHGFHIHQFGDLRSSDGTSAGGHFDPEGHPHGGPNDPRRHAGDLGNITANQQGVATIDATFNSFHLHHALGRGLVVHAGADDLKSQPSGNAGGRVAVGVIGVANPEVQ